MFPLKMANVKIMFISSKPFFENFNFLLTGIWTKEPLPGLGFSSNGTTGTVPLRPSENGPWIGVTIGSRLTPGPEIYKTIMQSVTFKFTFL